MGMWFVPLSSVLDSHGLQSIKPFAFATSAAAAFISPLFFGAMADRHVAPVKVLRGLSLATAAAMALAAYAMESGWNRWVVLATIQLHALCSTPTWSIASAICFARLTDSKREFGPVRAAATLGWMAGCWVVSLLNADASPRAAYGGAITWLLVAAFAYGLPATNPPKTNGALTLRERFGLDALSLLKNPNHRVVFITVTLLNIPMAAFYPCTPPHLAELGFTHATAWMTLGQVTEIISMLGLAGILARWRLKWVFATGLALCVLRFGLCVGNDGPFLLLGITLHGFSYTLVFITAQIYLDERVDDTWRARAQALLSLLTGGVGNLLGYLGTGAWLWTNTTAKGGVHWPRFWMGITLAAASVCLYFLCAYRGRAQETPQPAKSQAS